MIESPFRADRPHRCVGLLLAAMLLAPGCGGSGGGPVRPSGPPITVPGTAEWYSANDPIVQEYLTTLPESAVGQPLDGIQLSDGRHWFEGETYLGSPGDLPETTHVVMLRGESGIRAYMWIDEGGEPLPLEACGKGEHQGIRARRIAGQVYAWKALRPGHGVVFTPCPPEAWVSAVEPGG